MIFGSYNLLDLYADPAEGDRHHQVHAVIRNLDVDVLAVQEVIADSPSLANARLNELAEAVGLSCRLSNGQTAIAYGNQSYHVGLLWRPDKVAPLDFVAHSDSSFWHALAWAKFDVGRPVVHASYHARPFGRCARADEAERVVSIMTRPDRPGDPGDRPPGFVGADWNGVSADRQRARRRWGCARWNYYDPDPYSHCPQHPAHVYQTRWSANDLDGRHIRADREPGEVLYRAGLRDVAAVLNAAWRPTAGHWSGDPFGPRRIDGIRGTMETIAALQTYAVIAHPFYDATTGLVDPKTASDHLPVLVEYEPAAIGSRAPTPQRHQHYNTRRSIRRAMVSIVDALRDRGESARLTCDDP